MQFFLDKRNITPADANIRFVLSMLTGLFAVASGYYLLLLPAFFLLFTSVNRSCIFYHWLGINDKLRLKNFYTSFLPAHNPLPVYIFSRDGKILFQNDASRALMPKVTNLRDFGLQLRMTGESVVYRASGRVYQVSTLYHYEIDAIFTYISDITRVWELNREIEATQVEIINMMGMIGESRSKETGNHVKRVAAYSKLLAQKYGLCEEEAHLLSVASPMHDIGKVGIADDILHKPGRLTTEEFEIMKTHAQIGYEMLRSSDRPILKAAAIVAHEHHEKFDGSGYPRGLRGEEIHIYGRITAVADVFDALGSDRCYKKAWPMEKILKLFKEERGKHFDPKLVDILLENLDAIVAIRDRYQDSTEETTEVTCSDRLQCAEAEATA